MYFDPGVSMHIKLKTMKFKNLLSFGNNLTEFNFEEGMTLISAQSGSGKSSILDGLAFNFFGKPYRDIKISELINRRNKKGLYTETEFEDDTNTYKIIRTLVPNSLVIYKNGVEIDHSSSKKIDQEEINNILGIDYKMFKLVFALAVNYNKPFLSLNAADKRDVIESIFDIKVFGEMLSKLRKRMSLYKTEKQILEKSIANSELTLTNLDNQIREIEASIKGFDDAKAEEIAEIEATMESEREILAQKNFNLKNIIQQIEDLNIPEDDYNSIVNELNTELSINQSNLKNISKQIAFLNKSETCPLCGQDMSEEHKTSEIQKYEKQILTINEDIEDINEKLELNINLKKKKTELQTIKTELSSKRAVLLSQILDKTSAIEKLQTQKERVEARELNLSTKTLTTQFKEEARRYKNTTAENEILVDKIKIAEVASKVLSEEGVKTFFFKSLIPILNNKINETLELFELPININFDDQMNDNIKQIGTSDSGISYNSYSEGEKKRIDIAILLSFIEVTKAITNWNCNTLFFDEILDNGMDSEGMEKVLSSVKMLSLKDRKLCVYVISHKNPDSDSYDRVIKPKKIAGFSQLQYV